MKEDYKKIKGWLLGVLLVAPLTLVLSKEPLKLFFDLVVVHSICMAILLYSLKKLEK